MEMEPKLTKTVHIPGIAQEHFDQLSQEHQVNIPSNGYRMIFCRTIIIFKKNNAINIK